MNQLLPPLRLAGATVLYDGILQDRIVAIADGRIDAGAFPAVDLSGYYILPGIIDLHGDAFERHVAPRPSAPFPLEMGLIGVDQDAAANGVTTAWLAQSWSWEGGQRSPEFALQIMVALAAYRPRAMTDLRLQVRYETHALDTADQLLAAIRQFNIDYVIFNNHLDEAIATFAQRPNDFDHWAQRAGCTAAEMIDIVYAAKGRTVEVPHSLCRLAEAFDTLGVTYGSHDDPDGATRETYAKMGARICEFPTSLSAADVAQATGDPVLMGAPNVVRGGSQAGNIAAVSVITAGKCTALVSDYHYPALARAAFSLVDQGICDLPHAWAMISAAPAQIMRLTDRGVIAPGQRADLVILDKARRRVECTIVAGRVSYLSGAAAQRFMKMAMTQQLAAE
jgi:alpha-D-ribose 1-methylphosphonate 5-triphosphate diphosphatase